MKNLIKSLAVAAVAIMVLTLGAHRADASNVHFSFGLNVGVPVVPAPVVATVAPVPVYAPAPVYAPQPAPVYHVEKVRCGDGYGYRAGHYRYRYAHRDYRDVRYRDHRGWER